MQFNFKQNHIQDPAVVEGILLDYGVCWSHDPWKARKNCKRTPVEALQVRTAIKPYVTSPYTWKLGGLSNCHSPNEGPF